MQADAKDNLLNTLRLLADLFGKYREGGSATFVEQLIKLLEVGSPELYDKLNSIEMWGGMGSVWDYQRFYGPQAYGPQANVSDKEAYNDEVSLREAMISLVNQMDQEGLLDERVRQRAYFI